MNEKASKNGTKEMGVFLLAMIGVAAVLSIRNIPSMAKLGAQSIFYWTLSTIVILIPVSFISGELATAWPQNGGFAVWTREAFGKKWSFITSWVYWFANVVWLPTVLSFTAATMAYISNPHLMENHIYMISVILLLLWIGTFVNFLRVKISSLISSIGVVLGTIIPSIFLIGFGIYWLSTGHPSQVNFSLRNMIPNLGDLGAIEFAATAMLSYVGIELLGVYANHVKNPKRTYPKAIMLAATTILVIYVIATISVAAVVPASKLSLVGGLMEAFRDFFDYYHIGWMIPLLAGLTAIGAIALINTWILGPAKALSSVSHGMLPPVLQKRNRNDAPVAILILQASIGSALIIPFVLLPSISEAYWILTATTTQLYAFVYLMMFLSFVKLRKTKPDVPRPFKVPGGKIGMWSTASLGIGGSLFALIVGFFPPEGLSTMPSWLYVLILVGTFVLYITIPFIIHHFRRESWEEVEEGGE